MNKLNYRIVRKRQIFLPFFKIAEIVLDLTSNFNSMVKEPEVVKVATIFETIFNMECVITWLVTKLCHLDPAALNRYSTAL